MPQALVVPIQVDALVLTDSLAVPGSDFKAPFVDDPRPLEKGVHLHWALPDALTRGEIDATTGDMLYLAIPDRWVVVRFNPPSTTTEIRGYRSWVLDSRTGTTPIEITEKWQLPNQPSASEVLTFLGPLPTAQPKVTHIGRRMKEAVASPSGVRLLNYYPAVRDRFGFYDALSDVQKGPISYLVMGFYSRKEQDPIVGCPANLEGHAKYNAVGEFIRWCKWKPSSYSMHLAGTPATDYVAGAEFSTRYREGSEEWWEAHYKYEVPNSSVYHGLVLDVGWGGGGGSLSVPGRVISNDAREMEVPKTTADVQKPELLVAPTFHRAIAEAFTGENDAAAAADHLEALLYAHDGELQSTNGILGVAHRVHASSFRGMSSEKSTSWKILILPEDDESEEGAEVLPDQADLLVVIENHCEPAGLRAASKRAMQVAAELAGRSKTHSTSRAAQSSKDKYKSLLSNDPWAKLLSSLKRVGKQLGDSQNYAARRGAIKLDVIRSSLPPGAKLVVRSTESAGARWYRGSAPCLMVWGAGRSYRNGYDGRFEPDGTLRCRFLHELITGIKLTTGTDPTPPWIADSELVLQGPVGRGGPFATRGYPSLAEALIREAVVLDPTNAAGMGRALVRMAKGGRLEGKGPTSGGSDTAKSEKQAEKSIYQRQTGWWWLALAPQFDRQRGFDSAKDFKGTVPSVVAMSPWKQPWAPLMADVMYSFQRTALTGWEFGEVEYEPDLDDQGGSRLTRDYFELKIRERCLLTASSTKLIASLYERLVTTDEPEGGAEGNAVDTRLSPEEFLSMDVLTASLSKLDPTLVERGLLLRGGLLRVRQLRIVDAFGQVRYLTEAGETGTTGVTGTTATDLRFVADVHRSQEDEIHLKMKGDVAVGDLLLRPRSARWARVQFRLRDVADKTKSADYLAPPICGYLLPDYVDHALEVFDSDGEPLGQLNYTLEGELAWEPLLGVRDIMEGEPASLTAGNQHLRRLIQSIQNAGSGNANHVLFSLLRVSDVTQSTIQPSEQARRFSSLLAGKAIAVVRASLWLETRENSPTPGCKSEPVPANAKSAQFEFRVGSVQLSDDGVLGYFDDREINKVDAYDAFHPIDPVVRDAAFANSFPGVPELRKEMATLDHSFISKVSTLTVKPDEVVDLLVLVEPNSAIHVTSGFLPFKRITLDEAYTHNALKGMSPTIEVGPVMLDMDRMGLPLGETDDSHWEWRQMRPFAPKVPTIQTLKSMGSESHFGSGMFVSGWLRRVRAKGEE